VEYAAVNCVKYVFLADAQEQQSGSPARVFESPRNMKALKDVYESKEKRRDRISQWYHPVHPLSDSNP
jgi:hypothetical protein